MANHGEAQAAESRADFVHKLKVCLKELRESHRWLKLIAHARLCRQAVDADPLLRETDELIRTFVSSIGTAKARDDGARE